MGANLLGRCATVYHKLLVSLSALALSSHLSRCLYLCIPCVAQRALVLRPSKLALRMILAALSACGSNTSSTLSALHPSLTAAYSRSCVCLPQLCTTCLHVVVLRSPPCIDPSLLLLIDRVGWTVSSSPRAHDGWQPTTESLCPPYSQCDVGASVGLPYTCCDSHYAPAAPTVPAAAPVAVPATPATERSLSVAVAVLPAPRLAS